MRRGLTVLLATTLVAGCGGAQRAPDPLAKQVPVKPRSFTPTVPAVQPPDRPRSHELAVADIDGVAHVRPARLVFASGAQVLGLSWKDWGSDPAHADGTMSLNTCKPDCADGKHVRMPASIVLSKIVSCGGRHWYSRAQLSSTSGGHTVRQPGYVAPPCAGGPA